ncbi:hypothetical protein AKO1_008203 [Acrasis kona]|uniref:Uncharacterized protein n=1 Tax=Acrasis kona TaxID=1008807 RepID=A0AAW2YN54_9EUKA
MIRYTRFATRIANQSFTPIRLFSNTLIQRKARLPNFVLSTDLLLNNYDPETAKTIQEAGKILITQPAESLTMLSGIMEKDSTNPHVMLVMAESMIYQNLNEGLSEDYIKPKVVEILDQILEKHPHFLPALIKKVQYSNMNQIEHMNKIVREIQDESHDTTLLRCAYFFRVSLYDDLKALSEKALKDPTMPDDHKQNIYDLHILALCGEDKIDEALQMSKEAASAIPEYKTYYNHKLCAAMILQGKRKEAAELGLKDDFLEQELFLANHLPFFQRVVHQARLKILSWCWI